MISLINTKQFIATNINSVCNKWYHTYFIDKFPKTFYSVALVY